MKLYQTTHCFVRIRTFYQLFEFTIYLTTFAFNKCEFLCVYKDWGKHCFIKNETKIKSERGRKRFYNVSEIPGKILILTFLILVSLLLLCVIK